MLNIFDKLVVQGRSRNITTSTALQQSVILLKCDPRIAKYSGVPSKSAARGGDLICPSEKNF